MPTLQKSKLEIAVEDVLLFSFQGLESDYQRLYNQRLPEQARVINSPFEFVRAVEPGLSSRLISSLGRLQRKADVSFMEADIKAAAVEACSRQSGNSEYYEVSKAPMLPRETISPQPVSRFRRLLRTQPLPPPERVLPPRREIREKVRDATLLRAYQSAYREILFNGVSLVLMTDPEVRRLLERASSSEASVHNDHLMPRIREELRIAATQSTSQIISVDESTKKYESFLKMQWMTAMGAIASSIEALEWNVNYDFFCEKVRELKTFIAEQVYADYMGLVLPDPVIDRLTQQFKPRLLRHGLELIEEMIDDGRKEEQASPRRPYFGIKVQPRDGSSGRLPDDLLHLDVDTSEPEVPALRPARPVLGTMDELAAEAVEEAAFGRPVVQPFRRAVTTPPTEVTKTEEMPIAPEKVKPLETVTRKTKSLRSAPTQEDKVSFVCYELKMPREMMVKVSCLYQRLESLGIGPEDAFEKFTDIYKFLDRVTLLQRAPSGSKSMGLEEALEKTIPVFQALWSRVYTDRTTAFIDLAKDYCQKSDVLQQAQRVALSITDRNKVKTIDYFRKIEGLLEEDATRLAGCVDKIHDPHYQMPESEAEAIPEEVVAVAESLKLAAGVNGNFNPTAYATLVRVVFSKFKPTHHNSALEKSWSEVYYQYNSRFTELSTLGEARSKPETDELTTISYLRSELETIYREYAELRAKGSAKRMLH